MVVLFLSPLSVVGCTSVKFDKAFNALRAAFDVISDIDFSIVRVVMALIVFNWASIKDTEEPVHSAGITVRGAVAFPAGITLVFRAEATSVVAFAVERRFRSSVGGAMTFFNEFAVVNIEEALVLAIVHTLGQQQSKAPWRALTLWHGARDERSINYGDRNQVNSCPRTFVVAAR